MLPIIDFKAREDDDILISGGRIDIEFDQYENTILTAQRRICARLDDYPDYQNCAAGLEQYLFKSNIPKYISEIRSSVSRCVYRDGLLDESNFKIDSINTKDTTAKLLIRLFFPYQANNKSFQIFVDNQNQRFFRGQ